MNVPLGKLSETTSLGIVVKILIKQRIKVIVSYISQFMKIHLVSLWHATASFAEKMPLYATRTLAIQFSLSEKSQQNKNFVFLKKAYWTAIKQVLIKCLK